MNAYLKEIGKQIPSLADTFKKSITKWGVQIDDTIIKWKLLTTHNVRRSFAINEYLAGTPSITIMAITNHK
ncbi:MAG TPA: hypothetical protein VM888_08955 [Chitinophagaceae bacterium]|jgi:hypothetical protein|nr:hypothetical protein [Chitinophagaceae bacterium]